MTWQVLFAESFEPEFDQLKERVQDELLAKARLLEEFGPNLSRLHGR